MNPAERCKAHSWSAGMARCKNLTRRRHPNHPDRPICYIHGGI